MAERMWRVTVEVEFVMLSEDDPSVDDFDAMDMAREEVVNGAAEIRANEITIVEQIPLAWRGRNLADTPLIWGADGDWTAEQWLTRGEEVDRG